MRKVSSLLLHWVFLVSWYMQWKGEITSLSSTFPNALLLMCYLQKHRTAELFVSKVHRNDRRWTGVTGRSQEGIKLRKLLPWWMWLAWSWRSEGRVLPLPDRISAGFVGTAAALIQNPTFIFSHCVTSVQRLQRPWWSGGWCNLPTVGCFLSTQNSFPSLGVLSPSTACWNCW